MRFASCHLAEDMSLRAQDTRQIPINFERREGCPKEEGIISKQQHSIPSLLILLGSLLMLPLQV